MTEATEQMGLQGAVNQATEWAARVAVGIADQQREEVLAAADALADAVDGVWDGSVKGWVSAEGVRAMDALWAALAAYRKARGDA